MYYTAHSTKLQIYKLDCELFKVIDGNMKSKGGKTSLYKLITMYKYTCTVYIVYTYTVQCQLHTRKLSHAKFRARIHVLTFRYLGVIDNMVESKLSWSPNWTHAAVSHIECHGQPLEDGKYIMSYLEA